MQTGERMEALARAKASALQLKSKGGITELGTEHSVHLDDAEAIVREWPQAPKAMAPTLLDAYGPPNEQHQRSCSGTARDHGGGSS